MGNCTLTSGRSQQTGKRGKRDNQKTHDDRGTNEQRKSNLTRKHRPDVKTVLSKKEIRVQQLKKGRVLKKLSQGRQETNGNEFLRRLKNIWSGLAARRSVFGGRCVETWCVVGGTVEFFADSSGNRRRHSRKSGGKGEDRSGEGCCWRGESTKCSRIVKKATGGEKKQSGKRGRGGKVVKERGRE